MIDMSLTRCAAQRVAVTLVGRSAYRLRRVPMTEGRSDDAQWRITDEMWQRIADLLPPEPSHARGGRPRQSARLMMEGALHILATGSKWKSLPPRFGAASTVYGRFHSWRQAGLFHRMAEQGLLPSEWQAELGRRARRVSRRRRAGAGGPARQDVEPAGQASSSPVAPDHEINERICTSMLGSLP